MSTPETDREFEEARERIREQLQAEPFPTLRTQATPETGLQDAAADEPPVDPVEELERLALRPRLDVTEHLQGANAAASISGPVQIASSVPVVGPLLTLLRRLVRPFVQPFLDPYLDRQERFNAHVVRHLNELGNRLELRLERVGDPARSEQRLQRALARYDQALRQRHNILFDALEEEIVGLQNLVTDRDAEARRRADEIAGDLRAAAARLTDFDVRFTERAQAVDARFAEKDLFLKQVLEEKDRDADVRQQALEEAFAERDEALAAALELRDQALRDLRRPLEKIHNLALDEAEILATRAALGRTLEEVARLRQRDAGKGDAVAEIESWSRLRDWMDDADYQAFQDRFRGDAAEITRRMRAHVERFRGVAGPVADLGCGRGEFLALLKEAGVQAIGVETNEADVESCQAAGLRAVRADLFDWLGQQAPDSLGGIFMAQVIEHLRPRDWVRVLELASTRIAPGGVLVIETVNPVSLYAFSRAYVIDPTHTRPVHPELIAYLAERQGFWPAEIHYQAPVPAEHRVGAIDADGFAGDVYAQEIIERVNEQLGHLDTLCFAPQEYALVAVKPAKR